MEAQHLALFYYLALYYPFLQRVQAFTRITSLVKYPCSIEDS